MHIKWSSWWSWCRGPPGDRLGLLAGRILCPGQGCLELESSSLSFMWSRILVFRFFAILTVIGFCSSSLTASKGKSCFSWLFWEVWGRRRVCQQFSCVISPTPRDRSSIFWGCPRGSWSSWGCFLLPCLSRWRSHYFSFNCCCFRLSRGWGPCRLQSWCSCCQS